MVQGIQFYISNKKQEKSTSMTKRTLVNVIKKKRTRKIFNIFMNINCKIKYCISRPKLISFIFLFKKNCAILAFLDTFFPAPPKWFLREKNETEPLLSVHSVPLSLCISIFWGIYHAPFLPKKHNRKKFWERFEYDPERR